MITNNKIVCLECGSDGLIYYESGDYLKRVTIVDGLTFQQSEEIDYDENDAGVECLECNTLFDIEYEKDTVTIKGLIEKII